MKRLHILIAGLISLICLAGCSNNDKQGFYGTYTFEKVSYLSLLSSNSIDNINEHMAGTEYKIEAKLFKIKSAENPVEISSPSYVKDDIPDNFTVLSDVRSFIGNKVKNQYTILNKDGSKTHLRLYTSSDCLWIAFYNDNTADGSEVIMYIYKLLK
jgi:uncharacterized lipoprotein